MDAISRRTISVLAGLMAVLLLALAVHAAHAQVRAVHAVPAGPEPARAEPDALGVVRRDDLRATPWRVRPSHGTMRSIA